MRAILVVVGNVLAEQAFQMTFIEGNDVIQQVSAAASYPAAPRSRSAKDFQRKSGPGTYLESEPQPGPPGRTWHRDQRSESEEPNQTETAPATAAQSTRSWDAA